MTDSREPIIAVDGPLELEQSAGEFRPVLDRRPVVPEPLPVRLVAIADVRLPAPAGVEKALDTFYVKMLGFERIEPLTQLIYRAENFLLTFELQERPVEHDSMRATAIEVPNLADAEQKLIAAELEYTHSRGIAAGHETLVLLDPAGNWIELVENRLLG